MPDRRGYKTVEAEKGSFEGRRKSPFVFLKKRKRQGSPKDLFIQMLPFIVKFTANFSFRDCSGYVIKDCIMSSSVFLLYVHKGGWINVGAK